MPRKLRVEYAGAMYHVMSRGDQRDDIFLDDVDRHDFIKTLAEACLSDNEPGRTQGSFYGLTPPTGGADWRSCKRN